tara:strand:+ start:1745 stop:2032 length:288 start_codon:yes stop_codon:yes gene_type:complete
MKLYKKFSQFRSMNDMETLAEVSKMNMVMIKEIIQKGRLDKICLLLASLSLNNLRLRNRAMRKSVLIEESIAAALDLNRKLTHDSITNKDGEYID